MEPSEAIKKLTNYLVKNRDEFNIVRLDSKESFIKSKSITCHMSVDRSWLQIYLGGVISLENEDTEIQISTKPYMSKKDISGLIEWLDEGISLLKKIIVTDQI